MRRVNNSEEMSEESVIIHSDEEGEKEFSF